MKLLEGEVFYKIIGVVSSIHLPGRDMRRFDIYRPTPLSNIRMLLKLKDNQELKREDVAAVLRQVSSNYSIADLDPLEDRRSRMLFSQFTTAVTTSTLSLLTFFLTAIGLFGVISYSTQMRKFEIGTRMAIGAKGKDIIKLIVKDNSISICLGILLSAIIMLSLYIAFSDFLSEFIDWYLVTNFTITIGFISLITLFTCYWPLRKFIKRPVIYSLVNSE